MLADPGSIPRPIAARAGEGETEGMRVALGLATAAIALTAGCRQSEEDVRTELRAQFMQRCSTDIAPTAARASGFDAQRFCACVTDKALGDRSVAELKTMFEDQAGTAERGRQAGVECLAQQPGTQLPPAGPAPPVALPEEPKEKEEEPEEPRERPRPREEQPGEPGRSPISTPTPPFVPPTPAPTPPPPPPPANQAEPRNAARDAPKEKQADRAPPQGAGQAALADLPARIHAGASRGG